MPIEILQHVIKSRFIIFIYVDDILLFCAVRESLENVKKAFMARFACKNLGEVQRFLGVWIERAEDYSSLTLHQKPYCDKIVEKYSGYQAVLGLATSFTN